VLQTNLPARQVINGGLGNYKAQDSVGVLDSMRAAARQLKHCHVLGLEIELHLTCLRLFNRQCFNAIVVLLLNTSVYLKLAAAAV